MTIYGPRTRTRDLSDSTESTSYSGYIVTDGVTTQLSGTRADYVPRTEIHSISDIVTPNFHTRRANGEIINNPMTSLKAVTTENAPVLTIEHTITFAPEDPDRVDRMYSVGTIPSHSWVGAGCVAPLPSIDIDHYVELAVQQAWANIDLSEAAALSTIGEGEKTVKGIADILRRVYKVYKAYKRLDMKMLKAELTPKELANRYMELRYSIRPLVYDAVQISKAVRSEKPKGNRMTFRGKSIVTGSETKQTVPFDNYNDEFTLTVESETKREVEVRAGVLVEVKDWSKNALNTFGFDQPIETMWELTPFSFIFDWFFNIGETIAAWTPEIGTKVLASWSVVTEKVTTTSVGVLTTGAGRTNFYPVRSLSEPMVMYSETTTKTRSPNAYRAILPTVKIRLDALKLLDLGIILNNLRK